MGFYESFKEHKIVSIIRGIDRESVIPVVEALQIGDIKLFEVTMNTDYASHIISDLRKSFDGKLLIGAGTVLNSQMAKEAIAAGAQYLITPNLNEEVIEFGLKQNIDVLPGVMTPTEIVRAYDAGAKMVKVFPLSSLGVNYLKELQGPLGHIPMAGVGGITVDNVKKVLEAGAVAVGVGSSLINKNIVKEKNYDLLTQTAKAFVHEIESCDSNVQ